MDSTILNSSQRTDSVNIPAIQNWKLLSVSIGVGLLVGWKLRSYFSKSSKSFNNNSSWLGLLNHKLVLIVPSDIPLKRGNLANHCASASILAYRTSRKQTPWSCFLWSLTGQRKVVLRVNNSIDFDEICDKANHKRIATSLIQESNDKRPTVLAVGPGSDSVLNQITGHLKLL